MGKVNRNGLSTQPWGEPVPRVMEEEEMLWILIDFRLFDRKLATQLQSDEYVYTVCEVYEPQSVVSLTLQISEGKLTGILCGMLTSESVVRVQSDIDGGLIGTHYRYFSG